MNANWFLKTRAELSGFERPPSGRLRPLLRALWLRRPLGLALLGCVAALLAFTLYWLGSRRPTEVTVYKVSRGAIRERIPAVSLGRVSAQRELTLRAEFSGRVTKIHHRVGERVEAGEPLLAFHAPDLASAVIAAERTLATARAQEAEARTRLDLNSRQERRGAKLVASGAMPVADGEALLLENKLARQAALTAAARTRECEAALSSARSALSRVVVRAPWSGIVLQLHIEEGESLAPGANLVSVADDSRLHIAASIDEADSGRVAVGMPVELNFEAPSERPRRRTVSNIEPSVTMGAHGARTVALRVDLEDAGASLRVGSGVQVDVLSREASNVVLAPINSLIGTGSERDVLVVTDGVARRRTVAIGITSWDNAEIRSGLEPDDLVIANPASGRVRDGQRVAWPASETSHPGAP